MLRAVSAIGDVCASVLWCNNGNVCLVKAKLGGLIGPGATDDLGLHSLVVTGSNCEDKVCRSMPGSGGKVFGMAMEARKCLKGLLVGLNGVCTAASSSILVGSCGGQQFPLLRYGAPRPYGARGAR